jgi:5-methyltetrahydrofolate--homocysteine methyltransferase
VGIARRYPAILNHEKHGEEARKLFADAQALLEEIVNRKLLQPRAVYGFFPPIASATTWNFTPTTRARQVLTTFHFLRQQIEKDDGTPNWCLADFIAPREVRGRITSARLP